MQIIPCEMMQNPLLSCGFAPNIPNEYLQKRASHLRRDRDEIRCLRLLRLISQMRELPLPRKPRERIKRNPLILHLSRLKWEALLSQGDILDSIIFASSLSDLGRR